MIFVRSPVEAAPFKIWNSQTSIVKLLSEISDISVLARNWWCFLRVLLDQLKLSDTLRMGKNTLFQHTIISN